MKVFHGRSEGAAAELRSSTFTGTVWADPVMPGDGQVTIANVHFSPGARTFWHTHEIGQVLHVSSGAGYVCVEGGVPQPIRAGDVVWIGPNERHWHGAGPSSPMVHLATSIGLSTWQEEVSDASYRGER